MTFDHDDDHLELIETLIPDGAKRTLAPLRAASALPSPCQRRYGRPQDLSNGAVADRSYVMR